MADTTDPRTAAIEAMELALIKEMTASDDWSTLSTVERVKRLATAAFYAQRRIVRVVPIEATEEMFREFVDCDSNFTKESISLANAAGDLTRKPE